MKKKYEYRKYDQLSKEAWLMDSVEHLTQQIEDTSILSTHGIFTPPQSYHGLGCKRSPKTY